MLYIIPESVLAGCSVVHFRLGARRPGLLGFLARFGGATDFKTKLETGAECAQRVGAVRSVVHGPSAVPLRTRRRFL